MLSPNELLDIANTMYGSRNMKRFIEDMVDNGVELPILETHVAQIVSLYDLEKKITNCIGDGGK